MSRVIMLIPIGTNVGLTSIKLGILHAIERKKIFLSMFSAIDQSKNDFSNSVNFTNFMVRKIKNFNQIPAKSFKLSYIESLLSKNQKDVLMEEIISNYYINAKNADMILIQGVVSTDNFYNTQLINYEIANTLNAEIIFVISQDENNLKQINDRIKFACSSFFVVNINNIKGVIVNKFNQSFCSKNSYQYFDSFNLPKSYSKNQETATDLSKFIKECNIPVLGVIPWNIELIIVRAIDIARKLNAVVLNKGQIFIRLIKSIVLCDNSFSNVLKNFKKDSLLIIPADRLEVLSAVCLSVINGLKIAAILLTGVRKLDAYINKLCKQMFTTGLPIFMVHTNTWKTIINLKSSNFEYPFDSNFEYTEKVKKYISKHISVNWINSLTNIIDKRSYPTSPNAFRHQLTEMARNARKCIILPEGDEPRTIKAATICADRGIATCVLLGNPSKIQFEATSQNIKIKNDVIVIDPEVVREKYVNRLVELRKDKGITEVIARKQLEDNVILATLMLESNEVDGLVSGAVHTTANTIRPALQLIKTSPENSLVSSIFFMLLPEQVYVYGDCAINLDPTAEQLSEIAIQSADSAAKFGINPFVAMLSYSTKDSGKGNDVEKVRKATILAKKKRSDLIIDGPLQYDASVISDVAKLKAPSSPVAGRATVFIFPDLNSGNITYKAVQRSAKIISIGPMLQGMRKPVNDLSRGALVDDIVYTIALTAIQAT